MDQYSDNKGYKEKTKGIQTKRNETIKQTINQQQQKNNTDVDILDRNYRKYVYIVPFTKQNRQ